MIDATFTVNDTAPDLTGILWNGTLRANVTGATLALHIRRPDGSLLNEEPDITNATEGEWSYSWAVGDLNTTGEYIVEVQVTYANGRIQTFGRRCILAEAEVA